MQQNLSLFFSSNKYNPTTKDAVFNQTQWTQLYQWVLEIDKHGLCIAAFCQILCSEKPNYGSLFEELYLYF